MSRKRMFKDMPGFDEFLRHSYCVENKTMAQIANELGCTPSAVLGQLRRCGIKSRKVSDYPASEKSRNWCRELGHLRKGYKMTQAQKDCISKANKGRRKRPDYEFGGHEKLRDDGYVKVYAPDHPHCTKDGYVMKHILIIEREIGRYLNPGECVHHINHIRSDNRVENLRLMTIHDHMSMHMKERNKNRGEKKC